MILDFDIEIHVFYFAHTNLWLESIITLIRLCGLYGISRLGEFLLFFMLAVVVPRD